MARYGLPPLRRSSGSLTVVGAAAGNRAATLTVAGRALASPVLANGRMITVAENGAVEAQLSSVNHPPTAPILAGAPQPLDAAAVTLRWLPASDPDAELPSYELRLDSDGEVLQSAQQQLGLAAGATSASVTAGLVPGVTYTWSVRARDARGAYSPWASPANLHRRGGRNRRHGRRAGGQPDRRACWGGPGSVVTLGAGTFPLAPDRGRSGGRHHRRCGRGAHDPGRQRPHGGGHVWRHGERPPERAGSGHCLRSPDVRVD